MQLFQIGEHFETYLQPYSDKRGFDAFNQVTHDVYYKINQVKINQVSHKHINI